MERRALIGFAVASRKRGPAPRSADPCSTAHAAVPQQSLHPGLAAAKRDERFQRWPAPAHAEDLIPEALPGAGIEHTVLLEQAVRIRREDFRPLVAVVARRVAAGEDMREIV